MSPALYQLSYLAKSVPLRGTKRRIVYQNWTAGVNRADGHPLAAEAGEDDEEKADDGEEVGNLREKEEAVLTQLGLERSGSYYTVEE